MNSNPDRTIQTTLFNTSFNPSEQRSNQTTQGKVSRNSGLPQKSQENSNDFLLHNWSDYFADDPNNSFNVTKIIYMFNFPRIKTFVTH